MPRNFHYTPSTMLSARDMCSLTSSYAAPTFFLQLGTSGLFCLPAQAIRLLHISVLVAFAVQVVVAAAVTALAAVRFQAVQFRVTRIPVRVIILRLSTVDKQN
jgi:hypothetical protein